MVVSQSFLSTGVSTEGQLLIFRKMWGKHQHSKSRDVLSSTPKLGLQSFCNGKPTFRMYSSRAKNPHVNGCFSFP